MDKKHINEIAGSLLTLRYANGFELAGAWSVCSFQLEDKNIPEQQLVFAFSEELDTYYLGDPRIPWVVVEGEYGLTIFFLIPMENLNECGRQIFSFRITDE